MGVLSRSRQGLEFTYDGQWLATAEAFPLSLALPLQPQPHKSDVVRAVLDNLLPDDQGVRQTVARNVGATGTDPHSLLAAVGKDCVGALQFLTEGEEPWRGGPVEATPLSEGEIATMLTSLDNRPLGMTREGGFRISVAGAQAKTTLLKREGTWLLPEGPTPSTHILKPAIGSQGGVDLSDSIENEFLCLRLLTEMGLQTAEVQIEEFEGVSALVVTRFDREVTREGIIRVPQEDLCQAFGLPSERKYEADGGPGVQQVMRFLLGSDDPLGDRERFFSTLIAFWLLGATDGHAKNFSVFLGPEPAFRLTPFYDVISLQPYVDRQEVVQREYRLAMAVGERRRYRVNDIMPRHFIQEAAKAGVDEALAWRWLEGTAKQALAALEIVASDGREESGPLLRAISTGVQARADLVLAG